MICEKKKNAICKKIANEESKNMENGERVWDYGFKCARAAFKAAENLKKMENEK